MAILFAAGGLPAEHRDRLVFRERFQGSANAVGFVSKLDTSIGYNFNRYFGVDAGVRFALDSLFFGVGFNWGSWPGKDISNEQGGIMKRLTCALTMLAFGATPLAFGQGRGHGGGNAGGFHGAPPASAKPDHSGHPAPSHIPEGKTDARLAHNPALSSRLQAILPPGTNLQNAAAGFKNEGQFVAAAHVSHNLNIPFDQLKARTTGPNAGSLGQAIHDLKPDMSLKDANEQAKRAEKQAKEDMHEAGAKLAGKQTKS